MFYGNLEYYFKETYSELLHITTNVIYIQTPAILIVSIYIYTSFEKNRWFKYFNTTFCINIFFGIFTYFHVCSKFENILFYVENKTNFDVKNIEIVGRGNNIKLLKPLQPRSKLKLILTGRNLENGNSPFIKYCYEINNQKGTLIDSGVYEEIWNNHYIVKHQIKITTLSNDVYVIDSLKNKF